MSRFYAGETIDTLRRVDSVLTKRSFPVTFPIMFTFVLLYPLVLRLMFGAPYAEATAVTKYLGEVTNAAVDRSHRWGSTALPERVHVLTCRYASRDISDSVGFGHATYRGRTGTRAKSPRTVWTPDD